MKKVTFILVLTIVLFSNCISVRTPIDEIPPSYGKSSTPEIGQEARRSVGEILLQQNVVLETNYIMLNSNQLDGVVTKGIYELIGIRDGYRIYEPVPSSGARIFDRSIQIGSDSACNYLAEISGKVFYPEEEVLTDRVDSMRRPYRSIVCVDENILPEDSYSLTTTRTIIDSELQQTLLYTGKSGSIIYLSYREFYDDMARSAFTVDVTYDLEESNQICFRNALLEIIEATNTTLTYRVIQNFN